MLLHQKIPTVATKANNTLYFEPEYVLHSYAQ